MSAVLAAASASFTYQGASITLSAGSATELIQALAAFGIQTNAPAANDTAAPGKPSAPAPARAPSPATTAAPAAAPKPTAAVPSPAAADAAAPSQASTAAGDQGNGAAASPSPAPVDASTASSSAPAESPAVTFDQLKKAFLGLSTKADGRAKCEGVLKPFGLAKLSEAKPEQYAQVLAEIEKAAG